MAIKNIFNPKGTNYWIIATAVAANVLYSVIIMTLAFLGLGIDLEYSAGIQAGLMVAFFIGPLVIGWFFGWMAYDNRGPTYGVLGSLGSVALILIVILPTGITGLLLAIVALAGGFNGGVLSRGRRH